MRIKIKLPTICFRPDAQRITAAYAFHRDPRGLVTWESEFVVSKKYGIAVVIGRNEDDSLRVVFPYSPGIFHLDRNEHKPAPLASARKFFATWRAKAFTKTRWTVGKRKSPAWN